jgi:hypothetical protein
MQGFEGKPLREEKPHAMGVWWLCATLLVGPSILVWLVRFAALAMGCAPGPGTCRSLTIGGGLHDTLDLAWLISTNSIASLAIAFTASIVALTVRRPLLASLSLMMLPLLALVMPTLAVYTALYSGCQANEAAVGDCVLWGAHMGMSFHRAAMAPWLIYGIVPYCFTLALMIGAVGLLFFRQRPESSRNPFAGSRFPRTSKAFEDPRD